MAQTMTITCRKEVAFRYFKLQNMKKRDLPESVANRIVHIFSGEHKTFWREDGSGYTYDLDQAGIYTLKEAFERTRHCGPEKQIYFVWEQ